MLFSEIEKGAQISIVVTLKEREIELVTTVAAILNDGIVANMIYQRGKRVNFSIEGLSLRMRVVNVKENKLHEFRQVTIKNVKSNNNLYYMITSSLPSTPINRRYSIRIPLGVMGSVMVNGKKLEAVVKDISLTGIAFIVDEPLKIKTQVLVNFKDMRQDFSLGAEIVRQEELPEGRILYGCRLGEDVGDISAYLNDKQKLEPKYHR